MTENWGNYSSSPKYVLGGYHKRHYLTCQTKLICHLFETMKMSRCLSPPMPCLSPRPLRPAHSADVPPCLNKLLPKGFWPRLPSPFRGLRAWHIPGLPKQISNPGQLPFCKFP